MISKNSIIEIADIFCGDIGDFYKYKKGYELVDFFNSKFGTSDIYKAGFPSRRTYVYDKLVDLINSRQIDRFLNIVLSKLYIMQEQSISEVEAAEKIEVIYAEFNRIVGKDACIITCSNKQYCLVRKNDDLKLIGNGGFADVYLQVSTGLVLKKLKDDCLADASIRSRFKREYCITKSLQDIPEIIRVFTFDEGNCSYTMEYADTTLEDYINTTCLSEDIKLNLIRQILNVMAKVHKRDIIHRDISANNIFIISGSIKIADFGLGKDLNAQTSHQTTQTNGMGQYKYCAPEQLYMLKDGDARSDVYSLGRVINFIMTRCPTNLHHSYSRIAKKATDENAAYRYANADDMVNSFEKEIFNRQQVEDKSRIIGKLTMRRFDDEIVNYISNMPEEDLSREILKLKGAFVDALLKYMKLNEDNALYVTQCVHNTYRDVCRNYEDNDPFALFAYRVLLGSFSYSVKEEAAQILHYVARVVNRYYAQHLIDDIKEKGVEPMIEEILD